CSPRIQRTASTMLLFPEPLGPTMAVIPSPKVKVLLSAKLLNPTKSSCLSMKPPGRSGNPYPNTISFLWPNSQEFGRSGLCLRLNSCEFSYGLGLGGND